MVKVLCGEEMERRWRGLWEVDDRALGVVIKMNENSLVHSSRLAENR
jgi:hypothetical protein